MATEKPGRLDRLSAANQAPFQLDSLVGSFFHSDVGHGWQGCVVAQAAPGHYLCELFSWIMGDSIDQVIVPVDEMLGWSFYDTAEWMKNSADAIQAKWKRERETIESDS